MKKVLFILIGILCAVSAGATKYGTLYRGSGRGFIYTISSSHNSAASAGLAPAPVATMGSVSRGAGSSRSRGVSSTMGSISVAMPVAVAPMSGIRTAAATVSGGVTTYDKAPKKPRGRGRKTASEYTPPTPETPGACPGCVGHYVWQKQVNGDYGWVCSICGHELEDGLGGGEDCSGVFEHDACEGGCCCTPLELNWGAMLFLMLLAVGYGVRAKMREKCTMKENENRA